MADDTPQVDIEIVFDDGTVKKGLAKLKKPAADAGKDSGKEFGDNFSNSASKGLGSLKTKLLSLGAAFLTAFGLKKSIENANAQEEAVVALNSALKRSGEYTSALSLELQEYAAELQSVTRFGDEAIIEQMAFAQSMGATAEQSKEIVSAATDMAEALNIDLNSAVRNISKTLGGYAGELGEVIPELKNLTQAQLRSGEGIDLLSAKYKGAAKDAIQSAAGSWDQFSNAVGDASEEIGFLITKNPVAVSALKELTSAAKQFGEYIKNNAPEIKSAIGGMLDVLVVTPVKFWASALGGAGLPADKLKEKIAELEAEAAKLQETLLKNKDSWLANSIFGNQEQNHQRHGDLLEQITNLKAEMATLTPEVSGGEDSPIKRVKTEAEEASFSLSELFATTAVDINRTLTSMSEEDIKALSKLQKAAYKLGDEIKKGIGQGVGQGFAAFGAALVNGENALDAFAKSFLSTLGQMMVQQGTAFILQGIGFEVIPGLQASGSTLIATGAALAALGGALTAFAGSSPSASKSEGATSGTYDYNDDDYASSYSDEEMKEPNTEVSLHIHGDVLDSQESGLRIAELLSDVMGKQGVVLKGAT